MSKAIAILERRVEFIGLCGAGKSTFYELLRDKLAVLGVQYSEQMPKVVPPISALIAGAKLSVAMAIDVRGLRFLMHMGNWWLPMKLGYRKEQIRQIEVMPQWQIQIDSGLLQPIVSFAAEYNRRLDAVPVDTIMPWLALPRILIYLQAAAALALPRYIARENPDPNTASQLERQFVQAYDVCEAVVTKCRQAGALVITVDARESRSNEEADRVANVLRTQIGQDHS